MILQQMEVYMNQEASRIEHDNQGKPRPRSAKPSLTGFLALIGRLLFYRPVWTKENRQHHNLRFVYVHFSAWHFAGSDMLWAGIALRLFQAMQLNFGKLQLILYRVAQYNEEEEIKKKIVKDSKDNWRSKKICCCPLWFLSLLIVMVPVVILVIFLIFGLPKSGTPDKEEDKDKNSQVDVFEGLMIAAFGVPAASALRFIFMIVKNLIFTQDTNIRRGMDNERISNQLGFMNEVRKEMWFLSCFIQFMEVFERRRIRVVLNITNLDRCSPDKIISVLEAINILLSDEESPFISILAVNSHVLVKKVNFADGCFIKEERAYAMLNRIVTLAFSVPPLCDELKWFLFNSLTNDSKLSEDFQMKQEETSSLDVALVKIEKESDPLLNTITTSLVINDEEVDHMVCRTLSTEKSKLTKYLSDDAMSMRRVINSIRVTVTIIKGSSYPEPDDVAAWVVLANQWPCRLSWIMQCVEDTYQKAGIDIEHVANTKSLWKIFSENRAELYDMRAQIEDLLEQDGDPEMFEKFLKKDFKFTINDLKTFRGVTVNLDYSIRKELAQIRGTSTLKDSGCMKQLLSLPLTALINMDTEDVCKELEKMKYPSKYVDIVRNNNLNGPALVYGDAEDLKALLDMTFSEWATFRHHFYGLPPNLRPQHRNMTSSRPPSKHQLSQFFQHVPHHYS
ncbi:NTPase KAP family P-loop domain-containing protein 1 isoform X3 [Parambassis ranga]|nr:NTPase KAP family P-loop domain-containing protein 1 isoform X3 [Parambassis ranga]